jgi:ribosomal peptide maturation radical SAM protein 1
MPWDSLVFPSIQIGTLHALLERAGTRVCSCSYKLDFMQYCIDATAELEPDEQLTVADYEAISARHFRVGLADWVFAVPPFHDTADLDARFLEGARRAGTPDSVLRSAAAMRALVPGFLQLCVDDVLALQPRVVGFTTAFNQTVSSLVLAKLLKAQDAKLQVLFGGAGCEGSMGAALHRAFPWIDVVVRGEAERVLPRLISEICSTSDITPSPGLCFRQGDEQRVVDPSPSASPGMDEVPAPDFDEYYEQLFATSYVSELPISLLYEASRGCWWGEKSHCSFCSLNGARMSFRAKGEERVYEEMLALASRHKVLRFQLVDNIMARDYVRDLVPRLQASDCDLSLYQEVRPSLRKEQLRSMRAAGFDTVEAGIESLSTPILKLMRKGTSAFQNVRFLKWCAEVGIHTTWTIITGIPGEPPEEYARMADLVPSLAHLSPPNLGKLSVDRLSPYHADPADNGLRLLGPAPFYEFVYPCSEQERGEIAHAFEYDYIDGRDPAAYLGELERAVNVWQEHYPDRYRSLRYWRGPGFVWITDSRPHAEPTTYVFKTIEASVYEACEDGATLSQISKHVIERGGPALTDQQLGGFMRKLVEQRLVFEESGRYLALALPARLHETRTL